MINASDEVFNRDTKEGISNYNKKLQIITLMIPNRYGSALRIT